MQAAFLLCHTLSSVVTDYQISTAGSGGASSAASGAGQLADVFAGNGDKIFAGLTLARLALATWLITRLWDATHHWCFAALLLSGATPSTPPTPSHPLPSARSSCRLMLVPVCYSPCGTAEYFSVNHLISLWESGSVHKRVAKGVKAAGGGGPAQSSSSRLKAS